MKDSKTRKRHVILDQNKRRELAFLKGRGVSRQELSRMFKVSTRTVQNIKPIDATVLFL